MITLAEILEKTANVVKTEISHSGSFTPHFSALDQCGQLTVFALSDRPHLDSTFMLMHVYLQCFNPAILVLVFGHPEQVTSPTITAFDFSTGNSPTATSLSPSPTFATLPRLEIEAFLEAPRRHPKNAEEQSRAAAMWEYLQQSCISSLYAHPSAGNN